MKRALWAGLVLLFALAGFALFASVTEEKTASEPVRVIRCTVNYNGEGATEGYTTTLEDGTERFTYRFYRPGTVLQRQTWRDFTGLTRTTIEEIK